MTLALWSLSRLPEGSEGSIRPPKIYSRRTYHVLRARLTLVGFALTGRAGASVLVGRPTAIGSLAGKVISIA